MNRIVITGPESTGKTVLAKALSEKYNGVFIPEFARTYIEQLDRPYVADDILEIARNQLKQYENINTKATFVFMDTWLFITKVWLEVVFQRREDWLESALKEYQVDLYLLCATDIPWVADPVRENGGEMREKLFNHYQDELLLQKCRYSVIRGKGAERLNNAIFAIEQYLNNPAK